jgi:putative hydrolase of the HAD superfamily
LPHRSPPSVSRLPPAGIKAVFFDAGATLIHPEPPVEEVYARAFSDGRVRFSTQQLSRALTRAWEQVHAEGAADRYGGVRGEPEFWRTFLNRVRGFLDGGSVSAEAFARLASHFGDPASWVVYEDVLPALEDLSGRGLLLAVVSNWDSQLPGLLEGLGIASRFRTLSVSAIEQTGKPEPEIFLRTCARLDVSPAEALHVGDSVREDFEGARGAGLAAFLLDREDRFPDRPLRLRSLAELPSRIGVPE